MGGADLVILQHWLLRFVAASGELRLMVAYFADWLENGRPPWAAYPVLISGRLVALDKQPWFSQFGLRNIVTASWRNPS